MKFMLTFTWKPDSKTRAEGFARFAATGGLPPKGATLLGRWTRADLSGRRGEDWISPGMYAQTHAAKAVLEIPDPAMLLRWCRSYRWPCCKTWRPRGRS